MLYEFNPDKEPFCDGLGRYCWENIKRHKTKVAQIDAVTGHQDTFEDLKVKSARIALELIYRGIQPEDVISMFCADRHEIMYTFLATVYINAIFSQFCSSHWENTAYCLRIVRPKVVFCDDESIPVLEKYLQETGIETTIVSFNIHPKYESFANFLKPNPLEADFMPRIPPDPKSTVAIFFSSGSTGEQKGIMLSSFAIISRCFFLKDNQISEEIDAPEDTSRHAEGEHILSLSALQGISGLNVVLKCIKDAKTRVILNTTAIETVIQTIEHYKIRAIFMFPFTLLRFMDALRGKKYDLSRLGIIMTAGAFIAEEKLDQLREYLPHACVGRYYGMTELCGIITTFPETAMITSKQKRHSSGKLIATFKIKVVHLETRKTLGPNEIGEIFILTPTMLSGYYNAKESESIFDDEGYFNTGDIGYYDDEDFVFILDRTKNTIKMNLSYVVPSFLEQQLLQHPDVTMAVVIGITQEDGFDHAVGIVTVREGSNVTEDDIADFYHSDSKNTRLRAGVKIVDSIPLTPTGKPVVYKIREMIKGSNFI